MRGRLLVAYSNASNFVSTTAEYLNSICRYVDFDVRYVHVTHGAELDFDFNEFDAVFQSYCARLPFDGYVSDSYLQKMKSFRGLKLLAVQDEYEHTNKLKAGIRAIGYHVVFTNAPPNTIEAIYPKQEFPDTEFITVLTGYVPEDLERSGRELIPLQERSIEIGYRCRMLPAYYGELCFEKFEIGRRMRDICIERGIPHDIEWSDDKRLYGRAWYDFIGMCRTNLGSESGSNVFDFDGTVRATHDRLAAERGAPVPYEEFRCYTDPIERHYDFGQISPRIFEAAAMRTPLILYSGGYSGAIVPDEHYIELKKDFSNIDAVLARLDDTDDLTAMADRAYCHLVASGDFSYRRFCRLIEDTVRRKSDELGIELRAPRREFSHDEGYNPGALPGFVEVPTPAPRHSAIFFHRELRRQNLAYEGEIKRLNGAIAELRAALPIPPPVTVVPQPVTVFPTPAPAPIPLTPAPSAPPSAGALRRLLTSSGMRRLGRGLLAFFPESIAGRLKARLVALVTRL
ncbi:MAG TPA: hypothetical protein VHY35_08055 [Stellaceae bacterium]|jgi:hypothetical protein|nr:hypothetical protein [Stellaceae bacterium]